ncbi:tyrosine-type recombinase/integrase [Rhodocytophaga rosea]|uniref:Tyrosine-type recombinase/integrase n=2 Tax=Rhodocytophaga rosea TaxID=2704465 RepID=A0A6C0GRT1_9BACT|nr:tyrosine-type recombinase/integrase [Rhodocytophaga rosea]QHT70779.1 tyrosine-type recombinase/integrase [Rhodocytophaga rosea]
MSTPNTNTHPTFIQQACLKVSGFSLLYNKLERDISLSGRSLSTLKNYSRHMAQIALYYNQLPTELDEDQVRDYLWMLQKKTNKPSKSSFKHAVYGLRLLYRLTGRDDRAIRLPSIPRDHKLPAVLSKQEVKALLKAPRLLKHRVLLALIYSAGLRMQEVCRLEISDVDFDRMQIHIRQSKGRKDRYVPLSSLMKRGLLTYLSACKPHHYLFNGKEYGSQLSRKGVQWLMQDAVSKAGIKKKGICVHTLRHSYATHLLEDGLDIVSIKELLGHSFLETTLVYLHMAGLGRKAPFSPLDTLYTKEA